MGKMRHKERLTRNKPATGLEKLIKEPSFRVRAIAHFRFKVNARLHVKHSARFCYNGFVGVKLNFHHLDGMAGDFVVYFVATHKRDLNLVWDLSKTKESRHFLIPI
jgi:hypothetical protein